MRKTSFSDDTSKTILPAGSKREQLSFEDVSKMSTSIRDVNPGPSILKIGKTYSKKDSYLKLIDCECGPDLYSKVLGPTADEIVLSGLQTVLNVFGKFTKCDKEIEAHIEEPPMESKSVVKVITEIMESVGLPPEMVSRIIQTSFAELEQERPELVSKVLQTSTPEMISRILSTVGLEPEMISEILQTMSFESDKPSLKSGMMQTSSASVASVYMQTSDSHISEEPKEEIPEKPKMCVCCECVKQADEEVVLPKKEDDVIRKIDSELRSGDHAIEKPKLCVCCKCYRAMKEKVPCAPPALVEKHKCDFKTTKTKCNTFQKLCRCYECSAPVIFKTRKTNNACICPKPEIKCNCYSTRQRDKVSSGSHITLAKGDTCSLVETPCCCNKKKSLTCFKGH